MAASWQQGTTPNPEPPAAQRDEPAIDYNPFGREAVLARHASTFVRRKYGIEPGDVHRLAQHDAEVRQVFNAMVRGEWRPPPMPKPRPEPIEIPFNRLERISKGMLF